MCNALKVYGYSFMYLGLFIKGNSFCYLLFSLLGDETLQKGDLKERMLFFKS